MPPIIVTIISTIITSLSAITVFKVQMIIKQSEAKKEQKLEEEKQNIAHNNMRLEEMETRLKTLQKFCVNQARVILLVYLQKEIDRGYTTIAIRSCLEPLYESYVDGDGNGLIRTKWENEYKNLPINK